MMNSKSSKEALKRNKLKIRIEPEECDLIERAARVLGKTRNEFILDAVLRMAEDTLLDRTLIKVSPEVYTEFLAQLDAPPKPNGRLIRVMNARAPWSAT